MPANDRKGLAELIAANKEYLRGVRLQAARLGINAPPHLATEIERVEAELVQLEAAVATPVSNDLVERLDDAGRFQVYLAQVAALAEQLGQVRQEVKEDVAQLLSEYRRDVARTTMSIHARLLSYEDKLLRDRTMRTDRQQQLDGELTAIRRNQRLWIRIAVVGALLFAGIVIGWLIV